MVRRLHHPRTTIERMLNEDNWKPERSLNKFSYMTSRASITSTRAQFRNFFSQMSTTAFYNFTCKISLIVSLWVTLALTFLGNSFHKFKPFSVLNGLSFLCFRGVILGYKTTLIRVKPQYWKIEMNKLINWTQNYQFNCANYLLSLPFSTFQLLALNHRWVRC